MAMRWLTGEERSNSYVLRVDLGDGRVFEAEWPKDQDLEVSKVEHWRLAETELAQAQTMPLLME